MDWTTRREGSISSVSKRFSHLQSVFTVSGLVQTSYSVDGRECSSGGEADHSLPRSIEVKLA